MTPQRLCITADDPMRIRIIDVYPRDNNDEKRPFMPIMRYMPEPGTCSTCDHHVYTSCMRPDGDGGYLCWKVNDTDFCSSWSNDTDERLTKAQKLLREALALRESV